MLSIMFDETLTGIGSDCCEGQHSGWELQTVDYTRHGTNVLEFSCAGCGHRTYTETYRDSHDRLRYPDPDGFLIEIAENRRRHRR